MAVAYLSNYIRKTYSMHQALVKCANYSESQGFTTISGQDSHQSSVPGSEIIVIGRERVDFTGVPREWRDICLRHPSLGWQSQGPISISRLPVGRISDDLFLRGVGYFVGTRALHARKSAAGEQLLLAIDIFVQPNNQGYVEVGFLVTTLRDNGVFKFSTVVQSSYLSSPRFLLDQWNSFSMSSATYDKSDESSFSLPFKIDGQTDIIVGHLRDDGSVTLVPQKHDPGGSGLLDFRRDSQGR